MENPHAALDAALVEWFASHLLPRVEKLEGTRVGRNASFCELADGCILLPAFRWLVRVVTRATCEETSCSGEEENSDDWNRKKSPTRHDSFTSNWTLIREEMIAAYRNVPSIADKYDAASMDEKIRMILELCLSLAVHSEDREYFVNKIMELRHEVQHMLMISIQRQFVPAVLDNVSPAKLSSIKQAIATSIKKHGKHSSYSSPEKVLLDDILHGEKDDLVTETMTPHRLLFASDVGVQEDAEQKTHPASPTSRLILQLETQKGTIERLIQDCDMWKNKAVRSGRQYNNAVQVQHEMAEVIESQNQEISSLRRTAQHHQQLQKDHGKLIKRFEELEGSEDRASEMTNKFARAKSKIDRLHAENKEMRAKLFDYRDRYKEDQKIADIMAEKDRHETMALDLERQLSASKVTINQLIFELSEEQKVSQREKEAREKSEKRAEEVERQAKESRIALERALENLNDDYLDQKSMMRRKLDLLREEHKAAIYSFEMAFRTKLAEVCLQRDEYAEQVEMYREGKR